jgi:Flp pilus assembly protein TadD
VPYYARGRLGEIVLKACAYDPRFRYSSPLQMRQELETIAYLETDASLIYPEGDKLTIPDNRYITKTPGDGTKRATGDGASDPQIPPEREYIPPQDPPPEDTATRHRSGRWIAAILAVFILVSAVAFGYAYLRNQAREKWDEYTNLLNRGEKYREEDPEKAMRYYKQAQELFPEEETAFVAYAYTLYLAGDYETCIDYIEFDLELGRAYSQEGQSQLNEILGAAYFELDDYAAAASAFRFSAAGGDLTVPAMRDYAVSLGRLGDIDSAQDALSKMIKAGAEDDATLYVQGEIAYAREIYVQAEELFRQVLDTSDDSSLQRRSLRSLAQVYRDCAALEATGMSPIAGAAMKETELLNWGISAFGLQYDPALREMLGLAWYDAYHTQAGAPDQYLENSAAQFRQVLDMGMDSAHLYRNLYTVYYELGDYTRAAAALDEYQEAFPKDHMAHALRGILLITLENQKPADSRDYNAAYAEYWEAESLLTSADDRVYFLQLENLIKQLKDNGWL